MGDDATPDDATTPVPETEGTDGDAATGYASLHIWQFQAVRDVLWVGAVIGVLIFGYVLSAVTVPLLVALMLAYLFEPLVARLADHPKLSRPIVVTGLVSTVGVAALIGVVVLSILVVGQTTHLAQKMEEGTYQAKARQVYEDVRKWYHDTTDALMHDADEVMEAVVDPDAGADPDAAAQPGTPAETDGTEPPVTVPEEATEDAAPSSTEDPEAATDGAMTADQIRAIVRDEMSGRAGDEAPDVNWFAVARGAGSQVWGFVLSAIELGLMVFLIPFYFYFFSLWYPSVMDFGRKMIPDRNRDRTVELLDKMDRVVAGFVRGRIVISAIMGVMLAIGWSICGVPYAITLGLLTGIFCAVPYLGGVGVPVAILLLAFERAPGAEPTVWLWFWIIVGPSLVFGIVQLFEGYVLTPAIAGKVTNLDPVAILVAVLAGGSVLGVFGMLIAIPLAACLKIICTDILLPRIQLWVKGEIKDPLPLSR